MVTYANKMIIFKGDRIGEGDAELGRKMMRGFLKMLTKQPIKPKTIFFLGESAHLLTKGSPVIEFLELLHTDGVELLVCRAAVEWYSIEEDIVVGKIGSTGIWLERMGTLEVITL